MRGVGVGEMRIELGGGGLGKGTWGVPALAWKMRTKKCEKGAERG